LVLCSQTRQSCRKKICLPLSFITMKGMWKLVPSCFCTPWPLWFTFSSSLPPSCWCC
jgi:hypothetical protein